MQSRRSGDQDNPLQEERDAILLSWKESGGPRIDSPKRQGFGSQLMAACIKALSGTLQQKFSPDGFACSVRFKLVKLIN